LPAGKAGFSQSGLSNWFTGAGKININDYDERIATFLRQRCHHLPAKTKTVKPKKAAAAGTRVRTSTADAAQKQASLQASVQTKKSVNRYFDTI